MSKKKNSSKITLPYLLFAGKRGAASQWHIVNLIEPHYLLLKFWVKKYSSSILLL